MANSSEKIKALKQGITEVSQQLQTLQSELSQLTTSQQAVKEAAAYFNEILPELRTKAEQMRTEKDSSAEALKETNSTKESIEELLEKLEEVSEKVFGSENAEGKMEGSLIEAFETALEDKKNRGEQQEAEYAALMQKINDLLPGATSVGLAEAYRLQKDSFKWADIIWPVIFGLAIAGIVLIGALSFSEVKNVVSLEEVFARQIARLPFYLALVWLATFASKQQSQNKRLKQEYAHKETVSRSLEGYKREIGELEDDQATEAMKMLMASVVSMVSFNPSNTLDKYHGDSRSPFTVVLESLFSPRSSRSKKADEEMV
jgi:DNA repair exonuclease SbcCD ATPase subunit